IKAAAALSQESQYGQKQMRNLENSAGVEKKRTHPILWVPTSYFGMGTIYMTVTLVTTIMYRNLGMSDEKAAFWGSALAFPYVIKFLWAPLLEMFKTKKFFVVTMQFGI